MDIWKTDVTATEKGVETDYGNPKLTKTGSWKDRTRVMIAEERVKRQGLGELVSSLAENTGMHGMPNVRRATNLPRKIFWCVVLLLGLAALVAHVTSNVIYFFTYPTDTTLTLEFSPEMTFPAVTVCNMNPIRKSALASTGDGIRGLFDSSFESEDFDDSFDYDSDSTESYSPPAQGMASTTSSPSATNANTQQASVGAGLSTIAASINSTNNTSTSTSGRPNKFFDWDDQEGGEEYFTSQNAEYQKRKQFTDYYASMDPETRQAVGHNISWFLLDCSWQGYPCSPKNFTVFTNYMYGNCFTFNHGVNSTIQTVRKPGPLFGLSLQFYIEQHEYIDGTSDSAGVRVTIHHQTDMPFPEESGFTIPPGYSSQIGIQMDKIERVAAPYGNCKNITDAENKLLNGFTNPGNNVGYSRAACQKTCYQQGVINHCQCADPIYPFQGDAFSSVTSSVPGGRVHPCWTSNRTIEMCIESVQTKYKNGQLGCGPKCHPPCIELKFPRTQSSALWPSDVKQNSILTNLATRDDHLWDMLERWGDGQKDAFLRKNVAKLEVYFSDFNYQYIKTQSSYDGNVDYFCNDLHCTHECLNADRSPLKRNQPIGYHELQEIKLLSDLGGSVGLWLGFSVITLFEFIEFFMDIFKAVSGKCFGKSNPTVSANG